MAGLLLVLSMGCGSSDKDKAAAPSSTASGPATTQSTAGPGTVGPGCGRVPAALVSEHLGVAVTGPTVQGGGNIATCVFMSGSDRIGIRLQVRSDAADFAREKEGFLKGGGGAVAGKARVTDVSGVGDEAFTSAIEVVGKTTNSFVTRKGDLKVIVTSVLPIDKLRSLATAVLSSVPK